MCQLGLETLLYLYIPTYIMTKMQQKFRIKMYPGFLK